MNGIFLDIERDIDRDNTHLLVGALLVGKPLNFVMLNNNMSGYIGETTLELMRSLGSKAHTKI